MEIAQRFSAGMLRHMPIESAKRTTDNLLMIEASFASKSNRQGCDGARLSHAWLQPGVPEPRIRPKPFKTVSKTLRQLSHRAKARCELERKRAFEAKPCAFDPRPYGHGY